jgi:hypothetical protein
MIGLILRLNAWFTLISIGYSLIPMDNGITVIVPMGAALVWHLYHSPGTTPWVNVGIFALINGLLTFTVCTSLQYSSIAFIAAAIPAAFGAGVVTKEQGRGFWRAFFAFMPIIGIAIWVSRQIPRLRLMAIALRNRHAA